MSILALDSVNTGYRERVVGKNINLHFLPNQVMCLLGGNGCGKTTLLKTILGTLRPLAGSILVDGRSQQTWTRRELARFIGYVPQAHNDMFPFTVQQVVLMGRTAHMSWSSTPGRHDRDVARDCLGMLGIERLSDRLYTQLSGGERQLVLIARALAQQPRFLIMDEPTASLDFGNQIRVLEHINTLKSQGMTILFTTHQPDQAAQIADQVVLLHEGGIFGVGKVTEVLTAEKLGALYGLDQAVVSRSLGFLRRNHA